MLSSVGTTKPSTHSTVPSKLVGCGADPPRAPPNAGRCAGGRQALADQGLQRAASPLERVYVVVAGEATVITDSDEVTLTVNDSCYIPGGEARTLVNRSNSVCSILVVMPYSDGPRP